MTNRNIDFCLSHFDGSITDFNNNPKYIRASNGYLYGICSRMYYYAFKYGRIGITAELQKSIDRGNEKHKVYQEILLGKYPNGLIEAYKILILNKHYHNNLYLLILSRHLDFLVEDLNMAIEIKPHYSIGAYIQILIQKLISPEYNYYCLSYDLTDYQKRSKSDFFNVYPTMKMSKIYLSRILTARKYLTPIPPNHNFNCKICNNCLFYFMCYPTPTDTNVSWKVFKVLSKIEYNRFNLHNI